MNVSLILWLILLIPSVITHHLKRKMCPNYKGNSVTNFEIRHCDQYRNETCICSNGNHYTLVLNFIADFSCDNVLLYVYVKIRKIQFKLSLLTRNLCEYLKCPVIKGQNYQLMENMTIPKSLSPVSCNVKPRVICEDNHERNSNIMWCMEFLFRITNTN